MGKAGKLDLEMKEILRSFEQAEKDTSSLPLNPPPADEFDRIWTRIQAEPSLMACEKQMSAAQPLVFPCAHYIIIPIF